MRGTVVGRDDLLLGLAEVIEAVGIARCTRVAVDGPPGAGKTTLADELAAVLRGRDREVIRATIDDFLLPRAQRYRRGEYSAESCYFDAHDNDALRRVLLVPLGPGGDGRFRRTVYDHAADAVLDPPVTTARSDAVLLFDGVFLMRPELIDHWDLRIFVSCALDTIVERAVVRERRALPAVDVRRRWGERYIPAQELYVATVGPVDHADVVVYNDELEQPSWEVRTGCQHCSGTSARSAYRDAPGTTALARTCAQCNACHMAGRVVAVPSVADVSAVRRLSPLAADRTMRCGPFDVPVAVMASPTSLETDDSEEAHATRRFVEDDPWAGMGSVRRGGWMLLARDPDTIVIGQRHGAVGLERVVVLERSGNGFEARSMGGWRLNSTDRGEEVEASFTAIVQEAEVTVQWDCGRDLAGVVDRVTSRCDVLETATEVHFLLFSIRNPALPAVGSGFETGTGAPATATFHLNEPLGSRGLFNDFRVPAHQMGVASYDD